MRLLYVTHLTERNGATLALRNIIEGMLKRGVEVGIVAPSEEGFICDEVKRLGGKVLSNFPYPWALIKGQISFKTYITAQWKTYRLIKEFNPDIVHLNTGIIDFSLLGCLFAHIPMVWHAREYIDKDFGISISGGMTLHRWLMKLPFVHCVAITKGVFEYFSFSNKKDIVVYDGVISSDDECFLTSQDKKPKYFLYVGTFIEGKGAHVIFEQFSEIYKQHPEVELWLACRFDVNSDYYKRCVSIAQSGGFVQNIKFLGFRTDVYSLMRGTVAVIIPSRFEGFGFICAEAMYNECVVIGRDTAGIKEQLDKGIEETGSEIGLRFREDEELPRLMHKALSDNFSEMKRLAKEVVLRNYSMDKNVDEIYKFYERINLSSTHICHSSKK